MQVVRAQKPQNMDQFFLALKHLNAKIIYNRLYSSCR